MCVCVSYVCYANIAKTVAGTDAAVAVDALVAADDCVAAVVDAGVVDAVPADTGDCML